VAVVVLGERPYAEFLGDAKDLALDRTDRATLRNVYALGTKVISVLVSGRPLIITSHLPRWDAAVAAWLPGSQGEAVADVLFGVHDFQGKLPVTWPQTTSQIPIHAEDRARPLFPYGFGLTYGVDGAR
jgi:beta-glucosidase